MRVTVVIHYKVSPISHNDPVRSGAGECSGMSLVSVGVGDWWLVLGHDYPSHWFCLHVMNNRHKVKQSFLGFSGLRQHFFEFGWAHLSSLGHRA